MTTSRRSRACEACHSIKIKCELGSNGLLSPPCERCLRLNKDCIVTTPVRQKDRVAELEAKVEALTRLLEAQGLGEFRPRDGDYIPPNPEHADPRAGNKKRKLDDIKLDSTAGNALVEQRTSAPVLSSLDSVLTREQQQTILDKYRNEITLFFPLVPIAEDVTLHDLRTKKPHLLVAIIYAACQGVISQDKQEQIAKVLMPNTASLIFGSGEKSLELLQTIQITCLWYRSPRHHKSITLYQFITLAYGIALDLGFGSLHPDEQFGVMNPHWDGDTPFVNKNTEEIWRAWLVCHYLSSNMTVLLRRYGQQTWTAWNDHCLALLEYSQNAVPSDRLLCQFIRAERMCEEIAIELQLPDRTVIHDVASPITKMKIHGLQNRIMDWSTQNLSRPHNPSIAMWQHAVTLYLHESVLHTLSNKNSFTAPFVAERLSVTDFPTPIPVPAEHITSLQCLIFSGVALIDLAATMDINSLVMSPGLMIVTRLLYSIYILVKVYIACTGPGNTYGMVISTDTIQLESCFAKLKGVAARAMAIDDKTAPARILSAVGRMEEWFRGYTASIEGLVTLQDDYEAIVRQQKVAPTGDSDNNVLDVQQDPVSTNDIDLVNWNDFLLMPDHLAVDFGLEGLFDQ
nr:transcriptional regulator war1 [Quercus suber]